jgi:hypothetical protein
MALLAVELNDAALFVTRTTASEPEVAAAGPGIAVLHEGGVLVGEAAAHRSRLAPLFAQNRYWQQLSLEPLPWSAAAARTQADLAFAQLSNVVEPWRASAEGMILAVPPGYTREQLGLLAGIVDETGLPLRGLVDLGLAACASQAMAAHVLHLDLHMHQAVVTVLEHARADGVFRRSRYEILPGTGLLAIQQSLVECVATDFVRRTRFDPLYEAATEQRLADLLPGWIAALSGVEEIEAEIASGANTHRVILTRQALIDAIERPLVAIQRLVQSSRPAGRAVQLCVSHGAVAVPGLLARLGALRDCAVVTLAEGAAACGALQRQDAIVRPQGSVAVIHRLPVAGAAVATPATPLAPLRVPSEETPSHVLYRGGAWAITSQPLVLGSAVPGAVHALQLPPGTPGLSRTHCTLCCLDGVAYVEDHSTYGTYVNDERAVGRVALRAGDVLRLGTPGVALELIRVMPDDGAP